MLGAAPHCIPGPASLLQHPWHVALDPHRVSSFLHGGRYPSKGQVHILGREKWREQSVGKGTSARYLNFFLFYRGIINFYGTSTCKPLLTFPCMELCHMVTLHWRVAGSRGLTGLGADTNSTPPKY